MKNRTWIALSVALFGCSGATTGGPVSSTELKSEAASRIEAGTAQGDPCADNHWYGDGTCDSFCPNADTDCTPTGTAIVCADFVEVSDGKCSRPANDPCLFQDPDCNASIPPSGTGSSGGGTVVCAMYVEVGDGVCSRPADDPCRFQDPDCAGGTKNCDLRTITCQTFAPVTCPAGQVPTAVNNCYGPCVAESECAPIACPAIAEIPDGVCSRPATDPCRSIDPDCTGTGGSGGAGGNGGSAGASGGGTVCAMYIEAPDGVCSRPANDPCIFQDPDCAAK